MDKDEYRILVERAGLAQTEERYPELVRAAFERASAPMIMPAGYDPKLEPAHLFVVESPAS